MGIKYFALLLGILISLGFGIGSVVAADLTVSGDSSVGSVVTVSIDRGTSGGARLLQSPFLLQPPRILGNLGTLYLDRSTIEFLPQSVTTNWGGGSTITDVEVYIDPLEYSVGDIMYFQGLKIGPWLVLEGFTSDYINVTVVGNGVPSVPQNVVASDGNEQVKITWDAPTSGTGPEYYYVYRSPTTDFLSDGVLIGETIGTETYFVDTEATLGQTWQYAVIAKGNSQLSNIDQGSVSSTEGMKWSYNYHMFIDPFEIGDGGSTLFANSFSTFFVESFLFSTSDSNPPTPLFTYNNYPPIMHNFMGRGLAARYAEVYADPTMADLPSTGYNYYSANFRRYEGISNNSIFEYVSPDATLCCNGNPQTEGAWISDDGTKIISFMPAQQSKTRLVTFDPTGTIIYDNMLDFAVKGWTPQYVFSGDGSRVVFANAEWSNKNLKIVDTVTGTTVLDTYVTGTNYIYDVANDYSGSRTAVAMMSDGTQPVVKIYDDPFSASNEYTLTLPVSHQASSTHYGGQVALSDDGTKLAYSYSTLFTGSKRVGALLWDITNPASPTLLVDHMTETNPVTPIPYNQYVSELAVSADGDRFVIGLWGDGTSETPNIRVFEAGMNDPVAQFYTPIIHAYGSSINGVTAGKVTATTRNVAISPDGTRVAAGIKAGHANIMAGFREVNVYHVA